MSAHQYGKYCNEGYSYSVLRLPRPSFPPFTRLVVLEVEEEELLHAADGLDNLRKAHLISKVGSWCWTLIRFSHARPPPPSTPYLRQARLIGVVRQQLEDEQLAVEVDQAGAVQQPPAPADVHLLASTQVHAGVDPLAHLGGAVKQYSWVRVRYVRG